MVTVVLDYRLGADIALHDVLHGLWGGQGTGAKSIESNILQQLEDIRYELFY